RTARSSAVGTSDMERSERTSRRPPIPPILQLPVPVHHAYCEVHALERPRDAVLAHGVEDAAAERGVARARGHDTRQDGLDRGHAALPRYSLLAAQSFASACSHTPNGHSVTSWPSSMISSQTAQNRTPVLAS